MDSIWNPSFTMVHNGSRRFGRRTILLLIEKFVKTTVGEPKYFKIIIIIINISLSHYQVHKHFPKSLPSNIALRRGDIELDTSVTKLREE